MQVTDHILLDWDVRFLSIFSVSEWKKVFVKFLNEIERMWKLDQVKFILRQDASLPSHLIDPVTVLLRFCSPNSSLLHQIKFF